MSFERIAIPGLTNDEQATFDRLLKQLEDRALGNILRASYYDGKKAAEQVGTIIPTQYYRTAGVLGWSAKAVDMLGRRCNLDGMVWPDGDLDSLGYRELRDGNHLSSRINSAISASLIHGVSFLINTRGDESRGEPKSLIHVKNALNATGTWNSRRYALDDLLSITSRHPESGKPTGIVLYLDGLTVTADKSDGQWTVDRTEHPWGVPAEALVYKPSDIRPFGSSRISRPIMSIHNRALRAVVRMEGHMDVFSIPQFVLLGASEEVFKNPDGSQKASWQIALGRVLGVPDDEDAENPRADVKQFAAASPQPHIEALKELAMEFSGEASIPLTSLGVSDMSNPTSADSYIASREDLIAEAEGVTDDASLPIRRSVARGLAIQNDVEVPEAWSTIDSKWRSPVYLSRAAAADAGAKQLGAGPEWLRETEVGLELLGLTPQQITRALAEKRRVAGRQVIAALTPPQAPQANADGQ